MWRARWKLVLISDGMLGSGCSNVAFQIPQVDKPSDKPLVNFRSSVNVRFGGSRGSLERPHVLIDAPGLGCRLNTILETWWAHS